MFRPIKSLRGTAMIFSIRDNAVNYYFWPSRILPLLSFLYNACFSLNFCPGTGHRCKRVVHAKANYSSPIFKSIWEYLNFICNSISLSKMAILFRNQEKMGGTELQRLLKKQSSALRNSLSHAQRRTWVETERGASQCKVSARTRH